MNECKTDFPSASIREQLEQAILLGEYAVGSRLDEKQLSERFAVSRTPVREALRLLTASGLIEHRPHRGAFVRLVEIDELLEMFEVMAELEAMCGRLAVGRITHADLTTLDALVTACETGQAGGDSDHYYRQNEHLHHALYRLSGNRFLCEQATQLHRRLQPYRRLQLRVPKRMKQSQAEHRVILQALVDGDGEAAAGALRGHVAIQGERFSDLLALTRQSLTGSSRTADS